MAVTCWGSDTVLRDRYATPPDVISTQGHHSHSSGPVCVLSGPVADLPLVEGQRSDCDAIWTGAKHQEADHEKDVKARV